MAQAAPFIVGMAGSRRLAMAAAPPGSASGERRAVSARQPLPIAAADDSATQGFEARCLSVVFGQSAGCFCPGLDTELCVDVLDVHLHGRDAEVELLRDLLVRQSLCD